MKLHIKLENWFGDDFLITNFNNCIISDYLKQIFQKGKFTGFIFDNVRITKDIYFKDNYQLNKKIPKFHWMKIVGEKNKDDIFFENYDLYISNKMLIFLQNNSTINNMRINPQKDEMDDFISELIKKDKKNK
jgi:hypothetical protein